MPTLKLAVVPAKILKNGNHKVRIAIGHKNETRYIVTRFEINDLSQFKDGQVINVNGANTINRKLRNILNEYQDALDMINPDSFSPVQLREYLSEKRVRSTSFSSFALTVIQDYIKENRTGTAGLYKHTLEYFEEFAEKDLPFDFLTPKMIKEYDIFLNTIKGLGATTRGMHHARTKHIINEAIKQRLIKYEIHPYAYYVKPDSEVRELDISVEDWRKIRDCKYKEKSLCVARDLFLLSYYLGGINLIDLMKIDFKGAKTIDYIREKSKNTKKGEKRISITIPDEAKQIIKKWIGRNGKLNFGYKYSYANFRNYVTKEIHRLAKLCGIDKRVVYYSARKSLVQHGFELGIALEVLEYTIGQSVKKNRPIFSYVNIMRKHADKAIRTILDHVNEDLKPKPDSKDVLKETIDQ